MDFLDFSNDPWAGIFFVVSTMVILGTVFTAIAFRVIGLLQARSRAQIAAVGDHDYRELARQSIGKQDELMARFDRLERMDMRLAEVERMLREVDEPVLAR